jgi:hypothetical protein
MKSSRGGVALCSDIIELGVKGVEFYSVDLKGVEF